MVKIPLAEHLSDGARAPQPMLDATPRLFDLGPIRDEPDVAGVRFSQQANESVVTLRSGRANEDLVELAHRLTRVPGEVRNGIGVVQLLARPAQHANTIAGRIDGREPRAGQLRGASSSPNPTALRGGKRLLVATTDRAPCTGAPGSKTAAFDEKPRLSLSRPCAVTTTRAPDWIECLVRAVRLPTALEAEHSVLGSRSFTGKAGRACEA
jgi:hypothetical protein